MKKLLFAFLIIAAVLSSCSKDNIGSGRVTIDGVTYKLSSGFVVDYSDEEGAYYSAYMFSDDIVKNVQEWEDYDLDKIKNKLVVVEIGYDGSYDKSEENEETGNVLIIEKKAGNVFEFTYIYIFNKDLKFSKKGDNYSISFSGTEAWSRIEPDESASDGNGGKEFKCKMTGKWNGELIPSAAPKYE